MWDTGAISTAQYRGAALRDVLRHCGVDPDEPAAAGVRHVHFQGADEARPPPPPSLKERVRDSLHNRV